MGSGGPRQWDSEQHRPHLTSSGWDGSGGSASLSYVMYVPLPCIRPEGPSVLELSSGGYPGSDFKFSVQAEHQAKQRWKGNSPLRVATHLLLLPRHRRRPQPETLLLLAASSS